LVRLSLGPRPFRLRRTWPGAAPRGYLRAQTIGPLPLRRAAAAYPQTVNAVFRTILRQPHFTWAEHGEALLRRRKPWYYEHEPRPSRAVIGARLSEAIGL
jgi:hypothetical protein